MTEETKQKIKLTKFKNKITKYKIGRRSFTEIPNELIKEYYLSVIEASKVLNIHPMEIYKACEKRDGYIDDWSYRFIEDDEIGYYMYYQDVILDNKNKLRKLFVS